MSTKHLEAFRTFSTTLLKVALLIAVLGGLLAALPTNLTRIDTTLSAVQVSADLAQVG